MNLIKAWLWPVIGPLGRGNWVCHYLGEEGDGMISTLKRQQLLICMIGDRILVELLLLVVISLDGSRNNDKWGKVEKSDCQYT